MQNSVNFIYSFFWGFGVLGFWGFGDECDKKENLYVCSMRATLPAPNSQEDTTTITRIGSRTSGRHISPWLLQRHITMRSASADRSRIRR